jgi:hypothetical protein
MPLTLLDRVRFAYSHLELWFGLVFGIVGAGTLMQGDWESLYFWLGPVATVSGRIATVYPTNFSVNDYAVWGFTYRYPAAGLEWAGNSFGSDSTLRPGQPVKIEYSVKHPAISRLKGASSAPIGTEGLIVGLTFLGAGLWMGLKSAYRVRRLLAITDDMATTEALYERTSTESWQDDEKRYVFHYTYQVSCQRYTRRVEASSFAPSRNRELLVFQGDNPANAVLASALPAFIRTRLALPRYE